MEEVFVGLIKGFGTVGVTAIFFIYCLSKLPTIYSNYDSFANRNLKNLTDLTQSNTLDKTTGEFISSILAEHHLSKNFKQPISRYEINKLIEIVNKLSYKISFRDLVSAKKHLNLDFVDDPDKIIDSDLNEDMLYKEYRKLVDIFIWVSSIGTGVMAISTSFPNLKYYNQLMEPSFFYTYYITLGIGIAYIEIKIKKARDNYKSAAFAIKIKLLLERQQLLNSQNIS